MRVLSQKWMTVGMSVAALLALSACSGSNNPANPTAGAVSDPISSGQLPASGIHEGDTGTDLSVNPSPTPIDTPDPTPTASPTPIDTPPPSPSPTVSPTITPTPTLFPTPTPPVLPTPTSTPPSLPTPTPTVSPSPSPNPDFYQCRTNDGSIAIDFYKIRTMFGLRTYVTTAEGQYHVFTKPFCSPKPDLFAAAVSYVNPRYLHVRFPLVQPGVELQGSAYICMGDFCPGEVQITCDESMKAFFDSMCTIDEGGGKKKKKQK